MPEICKFYGIIISLYWRDHNPPHIHFTYGEYECSISVLDRVVDGKAPSKVIAKVNEMLDSGLASEAYLLENLKEYYPELFEDSELQAQEAKPRTATPL